MDLLRRLGPRHAPNARTLSAYADGSLDARAASALDAHLAECAICRPRLDELRRVRSLLGALPEAEPPRSFRVTRAMAAAPAPRPAPARPAPWAGALGLLRPALPALSGVSLGVFAVLLAIDASGSGNGADDSDGVAYGPPAAGMRDLAAESQPAADEAMAAPPEQDAVGRAAAATAPATTPLGFAADGTPQPAGAAVTQGDDAELPAPTAPTVPPPAGASMGENKAATAPSVAPSTGQEQIRATSTSEENSGVDALWIAEIATLIVGAVAGVGAFVIWSRRESG